MVKMVIMGGSQHVPVKGGGCPKVMVLLSEITVCRLQASVLSTGVSGRNTHGVEF